MLALVLLILGSGPAVRTPLITGVFPPGVTVGTSQTWTIKGQNLDQVESLFATGTGLSFGPIRHDGADGPLTVEVLASTDAITTYREIRADGPSGVSNLALIRVDWLTQVVEAEPDGQRSTTDQTVKVGSAVAGILQPLDVDRYRIEGTPGQEVTLDWETRRLGTAIIPVLTVTGPGDRLIAQVRSKPGGDRDCRCSVLVPPEGWFTVELRDNTYGGDPRARYRLRVDPAPFSSALTPITGPRGGGLDLIADGGSLPDPVRCPTTLPDQAGCWFVSGPIRDAATGRSFLPPGRIWVEDDGRATLFESRDRPADLVWPVDVGPKGITIDGRIDHPGQVDRFRVQARAGDHFRASILAANAGSWLDPVLTILGPTGAILAATGDQPSALDPIEPPRTIDGSPSPDHWVDLLIPTDGLITVELADRFGSGGPEYGYRLELGPPIDDFTLWLLPDPRSADPGPEARRLSGEPFVANLSVGDAFNLAPGSSVLVPFVILPRGRPGTIEVRIEGLPDGVSAEAVPVRLAPPPRSPARAAVEWDAAPVVDALRFRVDANAAPSRGTYRVLARTRSDLGRVQERVGNRVVGVDAAVGRGRPVIQTITEFPIRVLVVP